MRVLVAMTWLGMPCSPDPDPGCNLDQCIEDASSMCPPGSICSSITLYGDASSCLCACDEVGCSASPDGCPTPAATCTSAPSSLSVYADDGTVVVGPGASYP